MIVLLGLAVFVLAAATTRFALPRLRRRRMAAELRGDWWTRFERELRAYERQWHLTGRHRRT